MSKHGKAAGADRRKPLTRGRAIDLLENVLIASRILEAAGIEADGNDTAGKLKLAIDRLRPKQSR